MNHYPVHLSPWEKRLSGRLFCEWLGTVGLLVLGTAILMSGRVAASEQVIELSPGWNAVYLEVQPEPRTPEDVFSDLPLEMAWSFFPAIGSTEFIADPNEGLWNVPGWHVYLPEAREDSVLTNLYAVVGGRSYLLKVAGEETVEWTVEGEPVHRVPEWESDGFTLSGLPVNPEGSTNYGSYFRASDAHRNHPFYRLNPDGEWVRSFNSTLLRRGEAYWIFAERASSFHAPLVADPENGRSIDFGESGSERSLDLGNLTDWSVEVQLAHDDEFPLVRGYSDGEGGTQWESFDTHTVTLEPGEQRTVRFGVRRSEIEGERAQGVLVVSGGDVEHRIPLRVEEPSVRISGEVQPLGSDGDETVYAGLWIGTVEVDAVSDVNEADETPRETPATFTKRIIVHVDDSGTPRLLKEAILLWQDGEPGEEVDDPAVPGRYVLVSDHELIPFFKGASIRDGRPFGLRVSAASFDFEGTELEMAGRFGDDLEVDIHVPRDLPTNPYRHRFHPDHNHLDHEGAPLGEVSVAREEVWPVERKIRLAFETSDDGSPEGGHARAGGVYYETLDNLHHESIHLRGEFTLRRVNAITALNPEL